MTIQNYQKIQGLIVRGNYFLKNYPRTKKILLKGYTVTKNMHYFLTNMQYLIPKFWNSLWYHWHEYDYMDHHFKGIQLGGGDSCIKGFLNIDAYWKSKSDVQANIVKEIKVKSNSVPAIYTSHIFEHIPRGDIPVVLDDWLRVLRPGGKLYICVPDLEALCEIYLNSIRQYEREECRKAAHMTCKIIYGGQSNKYDYHYFGYSFAVLKSLLENHGFTSVRKFKHEELNFHDFIDAGNSAGINSTPVSLNVVATK